MPCSRKTDSMLPLRSDYINRLCFGAAPYTSGTAGGCQPAARIRRPDVGTQYVGPGQWVRTGGPTLAPTTLAPATVGAHWRPGSVDPQYVGP